MKIKLQKITANNSQTVFHISINKGNTDLSSIHYTFLADVEQSDEFQPTSLDSTIKYNKNSLYDKNNVIYYNMYDSSTPYYGSYFYKKTPDKRTGTSNDFQSVYNHRLTSPTLSSQILYSTQIQNYIYMLETHSEYGHLKLSTDINDWLSADNGTIYPKTNKIDTIIYNKAQLVENVKNNILSDNAISEKLQNVKYNMIYELPGNMYNDYETGLILAHTFKGKNQYDCEYNMVHDNTKKLNNIRNYVGIGSCNDQLYLKYDNKDYITNNSSEQISPKYRSANKYGICLPNIEIIKKINRLNDTDYHSTTLYSININIRKIFSKISSSGDISNLKNNVKLEIRNCVRAIAESIQPANIQLYHVYVNGE